MTLQEKLKRLSTADKKYKNIVIGLILLFALTMTYLLVISRAASNNISLEAENFDLNSAVVGFDVQASGDEYVEIQSTSDEIPLPADVLIFDGDRESNGQNHIYRIKTDGTDMRQLTSDPNYDYFFAKISPDRHRIMYHRSPTGGDGNDFEHASIWVMDADGTNHRQIREPAQNYGWILQGHAEWSPDSTEIALTGGAGGANNHFNIHVIDSETGEIKRTITDFQTGTAIDPSWSPDGNTIIFSGCDTLACFPFGLDIYSVPAEGGSVVQHTDNDKAEYDPYISPDGTTVAWLTLDVPLVPLPLGQWGIKTAPWNPSGLFEEAWIVRDGNVNSKPEWSADSERIYFARVVYGSPSQLFKLWRMNKDGTNLKEIETNAPGRNQHPDIQ